MAVYKDLWEVLSVNWALVVVGAFLLVVLVGSPALLKCVYLITFVFFLFIYQVPCVILCRVLLEGGALKQYLRSCNILICASPQVCKQRMVSPLENF